jgi:hypothetical protein
LAANRQRAANRRPAGIYRSGAAAKRARDAAAAANEIDAFSTRLTVLRERHRRRPSLIAPLDKAKLVPVPPD